MAVKMAGEPGAVRTFYDDLFPRLTGAARARGGCPAGRRRRRHAPPGTCATTTRRSGPPRTASTGPAQRVLLARAGDRRDARSPATSSASTTARARRERVASGRAPVRDPRPRERRRSPTRTWTCSRATAKFGHAAAFPLVVAKRAADGERQRRSAHRRQLHAAVRGAARAAAPHEVVTLFHEWGHILHKGLTRAEFVRFRGARTEADFVEAPSQIMEHWAWNAGPGRFARHHESGEPIPTDARRAAGRGRDLDVAVKTASRPTSATSTSRSTARTSRPDLAMRRHVRGDRPAVPRGNVLRGRVRPPDGRLRRRLLRLPVGQGLRRRHVQPVRGRGHHVPEVGAEYRREILEPSGSRDAEDLVRDFLGREPSNAAFLRLLGMG